MPEIKQGLVVKIIHNGHKTYGVVAGTTKALVTIKFVAFNPELGNTSLHVYHVQPASIILPQTGGFQKSPTAVLIRQLCGVYAADPVPVKALSITDADQPNSHSHTPHNADVMQSVCTECGDTIFNDAATGEWHSEDHGS